MLEFIVLGHVPGTNVDLTFGDISLGLLVLTISYLILFKRRRTILKIKHYYRTLTSMKQKATNRSDQLQLDI